MIPSSRRRAPPRFAPTPLIPASASAARSSRSTARSCVGANMENACYRLGICAEISALTAARQAFGLDKIARIAVAGGHVGPDGALAGSLAGDALRRLPPGDLRGGRSLRASNRGDLGQWRRHRDDRQHDPALLPTASARPAWMRLDRLRLEPTPARRRTTSRLRSLISRSRSWRYSSAVIGSG